MIKPVHFDAGDVTSATSTRICFRVFNAQSPNGRVCNDCLDLVERFDATEAQQKEQVLVLKATEVRRNPRVPLRRDCCVVCNVSTAAIKQEGEQTIDLVRP